MSIMCLPAGIISHIGSYCGAFDKVQCIRAHPIFNNVSILDDIDYWSFLGTQLINNTTLNLRQGLRLQKKYKPNIKHMDIHFSYKNNLTEDDISVIDECLIAPQHLNTFVIHLFNNPDIIRQLFVILQRRKDLKKLPSMMLYEDLSVVVDLMTEFPDVRISRLNVASWTFQAFAGDDKLEYIRRLSLLHDRIDSLVFNAECVTWSRLDMSPLATFEKVSVNVSSVVLAQGGVIDLLTIASVFNDSRKWSENAITHRISSTLATTNTRLTCVKLHDVNFTSLISSKWCHVVHDLGVVLRRKTQLVFTGACLSNPAIVPFIRLLKEVAPMADICLEAGCTHDAFVYASLIKHRLTKHGISIGSIGIPGDCCYESEEATMNKLRGMGRAMTLLWE